MINEINRLITNHTKNEQNKNQNKKPGTHQLLGRYAKVIRFNNMCFVCFYFSGVYPCNVK